MNLIKKVIPKSRTIYLLASLCVIIFLYPSATGDFFERYLLGFLFATIPLTGLYAVSDDRKILIAGTALAIPALLGMVGHFFLGSPLIRDELYLAFIVVYYVFTTVAIIRHLFKKATVDADTILSAVSAYLMIGLTFAVMYMSVSIDNPGAFAQSTVSRAITWPDLFYFSFVTLTTLGYGDIAPVDPHVRSLAILESVSGVLYMSTLIARLVSEYRPKHDQNRQ